MDSPELIAQIFRDFRTPDNRTSPEYAPNYKIHELQKARQYSKSRKRTDDVEFVERGPANVAGRTRAVLVDPSDPTNNTWLAGSATGGIWKTEDGGQSWVNKTSDLPNLGTNTLAMSPSNPSVIYAGTGEHFTNDIDGAGLFKSMDGGDSWEQITDATEFPDMRNISRIIVDPNDENVVLLSSRNSIWSDQISAAIYKSKDGGNSWMRVLSSDRNRYDDLDFKPDNFDVQFVSVLGQGVLRSLDGGDTWSDASNGLEPLGRLEITISPVQTNRIWASVQGGLSGNGSDLYVSSNLGNSWSLVTAQNLNANPNFLDGQGWYDNIIMAHPYDEDIAYVGGVNLWKFQLTGGLIDITRHDLIEDNTQSFMTFVNGNFVGGGVDIADDLPAEEAISVEIRFGQGTQMGHRFTVDMRGAGVQPPGYFYQDYVEVPFQVWDTETNRQLMVSFRDQQEDGRWNLRTRNVNGPSEDDSREYIFVHNITYQDQADPNISVDGGHVFNQLYFMWPVSPSGTQFDAGNLPQSNLIIQKQIIRGLERNVDIISDAYDDFNGINNFSSEEFLNNEGMHPDQHNIIALLDQPLAQSFRLLVANDGGLYVSDQSVDPGSQDNSFSYAGFGYNTSQFYGADKMPGQNRYIGGMQDNSTWFTPEGVSADAESNYQFAFGGDGFEALWNNRDPRLLMGSVQFNSLRRSTDGGRTWQNGRSGIDDAGPFISRLANSKWMPDRIFTVGSSGIWRSENFGAFWLPTRLDSLWSFNSSADIQVSDADPDVIWAGGAMSEGRRLFVSEDGGLTFEPTWYYQDDTLGLVTGIGTHPTERSTAYALFSFADKPKVLRTENLGRSWEDISGFDGKANESSRGFPDVAVNALFVFPNNTDRIWVGTEIGIVESLDNGLSWSLLDEDLPALNVWDFRLQDDQIVIATYGRGIWTATVEGIEQDIIFGPLLKEVVLDISGNIKADLDLATKYDSIQVRIEGIPGITIKNNDIGNLIVNLGAADLEGVISIDAIGFFDSVSYESFPLSLQVFRPEDPVREYFNDFSETERLDEFIGDGFSVRLEEGFEDLAIHSIHDYRNNIDIQYQLKTPIIVSEDQLFSYRDVAIVEVGEEDSEFGEIDFYDFVVTEGSKNGLDWIPLEDGYDARINSNWETVFEEGGQVTSELYQYRELSLSNSFDIGDTIFIRFRLVTDPGLVAWGWAIDDVSIAIESSTPVIELTTEDVQIFPSPADTYLQFNFGSRGIKGRIHIVDLAGRRVAHSIVNGEQSLVMDVSHLQTGMYFVHLDAENESGLTKIFVE